MIKGSKGVLSAGIFSLFFFYIFLGPTPFVSAEGTINSNMYGESDYFKQIFIIFLFVFSMFLVKLDPSFFILFLMKNTLLSAFLLWCFLSVLWAPDFFVSLRRFFLMIFVVFILQTLTRYMTSYSVIHRLWVVLTVLLLIDLLVIILIPSIGVAERGWKGVHVHKNTLGFLSVFGVIFSVAILLKNIRNNREYITIQQFFAFSMVLIATVILYKSESKTSMVVLAVCIFFVLLMRFSRPRFSVIFVSSMLVGGILFVVDLIFDFVGFSKVVFYSLDDEFLTGRIVIWRFLIDYIIQSPFIGYGFGGFWGLGESSLYWGERGWWVEKVGEGHSGYLDLLVSLGVVGLGLFVILMISVFKRMVQHYSKTKSLESLAFSSIFVFCVFHNFAESSLLNSTQAVWIMLILILVTSEKAGIEDC